MGGKEEGGTVCGKYCADDTVFPGGIIDMSLIATLGVTVVVAGTSKRCTT